MALSTCAHGPDPRAHQIASAVPLGWVDGKAIVARDLEPGIQTRLRELHDDCAQRHFALRWSGLEDAMANELLTLEAKRRGVSLEALVQQEIDSRVGVASEEEIRGLYETNREIIQAPYAQAAPVLRQQYQLDRAQALRRALTDRLRQGHTLRYTLPPPELERFALKAQGPCLGPPQARVTLVLFSDFTCPYSAQARRLVKRLLQIYPETLRVIYQDFPLEQHPLARQAAQAAHCAYEQKQFWPFYDILFDNSGHFQGTDWLQYARQAKLNIADFTTCLTSNRAAVAVTQSQIEARQLGVKGTPAFFINGMRLTGVLPLPLMQAFIDHELMAPKSP